MSPVAHFAKLSAKRSGRAAHPPVSPWSHPYPAGIPACRRPIVAAGTRAKSTTWPSSWSTTRSIPRRPYRAATVRRSSVTVYRPSRPSVSPSTPGAPVGPTRTSTSPSTAPTRRRADGRAAATEARTASRSAAAGPGPERDVAARARGGQGGEARLGVGGGGAGPEGERGGGVGRRDRGGARRARRRAPRAGGRGERRGTCREGEHGQEEASGVPHAVPSSAARRPRTSRLAERPGRSARPAQHRDRVAEGVERVRAVAEPPDDALHHEPAPPRERGEQRRGHRRAPSAAAREEAAVAAVGVVDRGDPAWPQDALDLGEITGLVGRRDVDEHVERPDRVDARVGDAGERRAGRQHVVDVVGAGKPLGEEVERALRDVDEHQPLRARLEDHAPPPAAGADLDDRPAGGDLREEDLVDERLLPRLGGGPLLAEARPVPPVPALAVLAGAVVAPRAVRGAEDAARALDVQHRVLHALAEPAGGAQ